MSNQEKTPFFSALLNYSKSNVTSFDVPGHKLGKLDNELIDNGGRIIYELDANAPRGLDNLNHPKGVIKEAERLCAEAFSAKHAYFLVNGCSAAIQTMLLSAVRENEYILLPRNSHKSVISSLIISGAIPIFMEPRFDEEYGIAKNMDFDVVKDAIDNNPFIKAILIIHPTYFGEVSDLKRIIEYAHERNIKVLVDEAHGTHFTFNDNLPQSAISCGADMVATSMHKTGLSLTQSSVLLTNSVYIKDTDVRTAINILQTTSPSSLLIASIDIARKELYYHAGKRLDTAIELTEAFIKKVKKLKYVDVLDNEYFKKTNTFDYDKSKIIISLKRLGISGLNGYKLLKDKYNIQAELGERYVILFVVTSSTTKQDLDNLYNALSDIDESYIPVESKPTVIPYVYPKQMLKPREAYNSKKIDITLEESLGYIAAESIMIYPPGIPLIIPGEQIDASIIEVINDYIQNDSLFFKDSPDGLIRVVKK